MRTITKSDWKKIRSSKPELLSEACESILDEVQKLINQKEKDSHSRYLAMYKLLRERDREIAMMFNDIRGSNVIFKIAAWRKNGLLKDRLFEQFSQQTREAVEDCLVRFDHKKIAAVPIAR